MEIRSQGIYKSGVIQPEQPLALPDNTKVRFVLVPERETQPSTETVSRPKDRTADLVDTELPPNGLHPERPAAPCIRPGELEERIRKYSFSAPSLPADFSREDIYSDHD